MAERRRGWWWLGGFALCAALVGARWLVPVDHHATVLVQRYGQRWLDEALFGFTLLGSIESTLLLVGVIGLWLWARGHRRAAVVFLLVFAAITLTELTLKCTLPQPHVPRIFHRSPAPGFLWLHVRTPYAFPSGHTLRSVFILGYVAALVGRGTSWHRRLRALLRTVIALVCISRVYLGDHWATDVLGGYLLAMAGLWWLQRHRRPPVLA